MYYGQQQMNNYYYVNGLEGAKQYQMMPNQTILLQQAFVQPIKRFLNHDT